MGIDGSESPALRDAKHRARHVLIERFVQGQIDAEQLDRRLDRLEHTCAVASIGPVLADLASLGQLAAAGVDRPTRDVTAAFGARTRTGPWRPERRVDVVALFGDVTLDFSTAQLMDGVTVVDLVVSCAAARILVPTGLAVAVEVEAFLSSLQRDSRVPDHPLDADAPSLRIIGHTLLGRLDLRLVERSECEHN